MSLAEQPDWQHGSPEFCLSVLDQRDLGTCGGLPRREGHDVINIQGMHSIHEIERHFINEHGLEAFWKSDWDPTDVLRRPAI